MQAAPAICPCICSHCQQLRLHSSGEVLGAHRMLGSSSLQSTGHHTSSTVTERNNNMTINVHKVQHVAVGIHAMKAAPQTSISPHYRLQANQQLLCMTHCTGERGCIMLHDASTTGPTWCSAADSAGVVPAAGILTLLSTRSMPSTHVTSCLPLLIACSMRETASSTLLSAPLS
jgi:hypothetical protein